MANNVNVILSTITNRYYCYFTMSRLTPQRNQNQPLLCSLRGSPERHTTLTKETDELQLNCQLLECNPKIPSKGGCVEWVVECAHRIHTMATTYVMYYAPHHHHHLHHAATPLLESSVISLADLTFCTVG